MDTSLFPALSERVSVLERNTTRQPTRHCFLCSSLSLLNFQDLVQLVLF